MAKKNNRDDFSKATKENLAKRVAYHCSNPDCDIVTIAPDSSTSKSITIGVAAHICAAAPGGKRYDAAMTSQERSAIENGIWLCESCAKLIDSDEQAYPVELLHEWKKAAEGRAHNRLVCNERSAQAKPACRKKILYIYKLLQENGYRHIKNRTLVETLGSFYTVTLKYGILEDSKLSTCKEEMQSRFIPASMLACYDAVLIEGNLGVLTKGSDLKTDKFSADALRNYRLNGGVLIFLSDDQPDGPFLPLYNRFLAHVGFPTLETPRSEMQFPDLNHGADETSVIYGIDIKKAIEHDSCYFQVDLQHSRKLGPVQHNILKDVNTVSVCVPLQLSPFSTTLLIGNSTTKLLSDDCYWDGCPLLIFGAYNDVIAGTAVTITGGICNDILIHDGNTDAIRLIQNILQFFIQAEAQRKALQSADNSELETAPI